MEFVAYSTDNYKILSDVWKKSLLEIVSEEDIHLKIDNISVEYKFMDTDYCKCIEQKLKNLLEFEPSKDLIVSSDCDIQFFKSGDWNALVEGIKKSPRQIFFMRDENRKHVNGGFYIVKREYFINVYKDFIRRMLEHGIKGYYYADQGYINDHRDEELDWDYIPDEYIISDAKYDLNRVCIHHATDDTCKTLMDKLVCMKKVRSMIFDKVSDNLKIRGDYELVVAKYKENISWTKKYANVKVYDKGPGGNTPNIGRESHTYLTYIVDNYDRLPGTVYFSQGCISDHGVNEDQFTSTKYSIDLMSTGTIDGRTHVGSDGTCVYPKEELNIHDWFHTYVDDSIQVEKFPIKIWWNGIFSVSRERIHSRTKEYYKMLLDLIPKTKNPEIAYHLERSWYYIFKDQTPKNYQVYVVFHDDSRSERKTKCIQNVYDWMKPYKLNSTKYFESERLLSMDIDYSCKYVGVVTYKYVDTTSFLTQNIDTILATSDADVITLHNAKNHKLRNVWRDHGQTFVDIWTRLLRKLLPDDVDIMSDSIALFYRNYWFAKPHVMKEYQDFMKKAVILLEEDPCVYDDSKYVGTISKEKLLKISGKPYYTYHPFILERLPCIFFWYKNYSIKHVPL